MMDKTSADPIPSTLLISGDAPQLGRALAEDRQSRRRWSSLMSDGLSTDDDFGIVTNEWRDAHRERLVAGAEDIPPDTVTWGDLDVLTEVDPAAGEALWGRVKRAARDDIDSGWRAARAVSRRHHDGAWERAEFLALRDALREEWRPRAGVEASLVDMLAQIQTAFETWMLRHIDRISATASVTTQEEAQQAEWDGVYLPLRVSHKEELDQTAAMVDRWQRAYLRTVRALRDLRRHAGVVINNPGQVNLAEQQVNLSGGNGPGDRMSE